MRKIVCYQAGNTSFPYDGNGCNCFGSRNEYRALVETVGGTYLNINLNSDERINPFDLPRSLKDTDSHPGDLLRGAIVNMLGLLHLML